MMMIYLYVRFEFDWTKRLQVGVWEQHVDGQTNVRHINLVGRLVTCNPPKMLNKQSVPMNGLCVS